MTDFRTRLGDELVRAASPAAAARARRPRLPALAAALVAVAGVALVLVLGRPDAATEEHSGGAAPLAVLARPQTAADRGPAARQAEAALRGTLALRAAGTRLLATDPDGRPYVLVPVASFPVVRARTSVPWTVRDGLCVVTRTVEGAAPRCWSVPAVAAGLAHGAVARRAYGLVPDGVAAVQARGGGPRVRVRHNFYVLDRPARDFERARWFDAGGREVTPARPTPRASGGALGLEPVPAPDLAVPQAGGGPALALGDLPRAPALITFGASWCPPCRAQEPLLREARAHGLTVVVIATADAAADAAATDARIGSGVVTLLDKRGALKKAWRVGAVPATFVVDADRHIVMGREGRFDEGFLRDALAAVALR